MKKGNWTLLLLVAVLLSTVAIAAVERLNGPPRSSHVSDSVEPLYKLSSWEYAWSDPPRQQGRDKEVWADRPGQDWHSLEKLMNPKGRNDNHIVWMRSKLPEDIGPEPHLLIQARQLFEVYINDKLVFSHGSIREKGSHYIGTPPRLVTLPKEAGGQMLYIRVYSYDSGIGLYQKPVLASRSALIMEMVRHQAVRFILGCFFILTGLLALYPYGKLKQIYLSSFAGFAVSFGVYTLIRTSLVYLLVDDPAFWMIAELVTLVLTFGLICSFTEQLFSLRFIRRGIPLSTVHLWYGAVAIPLLLLHAVEGTLVLYVYQVLLLLSIVLAVFRIGKMAYRRDREAQMLLGGIIVLCVSGTVDIIRQMVAPESPLPELAYWGVFILLVNLIIVIIRRIHMMLLRLSNTEKLSMAGQMAAGVVHEIRNPVTVISGYLQLMRRNSTHKPVIELMLGEVNRIEQLVNEFLFLARPSEPKYDKKYLDNIIRDVLRLFDAQASSSLIDMSFSCPEELPPVYCDENQLKQVLVNVIKNAMEAMSLEGGELAVSMRIAGTSIVITISDTGCGIAAADLSKIGEPFFTTKENGNGLGIMICRRIIENHRGKFLISSIPGLGTTVEIFLPLCLKKS